MIDRGLTRRGFLLRRFDNSSAPFALLAPRDTIDSARRPPPPHRRHPMRIPIIATLFLCLAPAFAHAGGGPENFFLVVNRQSPGSLTIANHYIALRQIPSSNIHYLDWNGDLNSTTIGVFREKILLPVLKKIEERGLTTHIDGILYSSDFPYLIDFKEDLPANQKNEMSPAGSITGLTYLYQFSLAKQPVYRSLGANFYFRPVSGDQEREPTHGFRGWYGWAPGGALSEAGGQRYMLSTMLGVTTGKGNSVDEVVAYLRRSASADGTRPQGTIYYAKRNDPRVSPRLPLFEPAVAALQKLGVNAEIFEPTEAERGLPVNKDDVMGLMTGVAVFVWGNNDNKILPGAICENCTSYGAEFPFVNKQTLLSDFLRAGAAGSSGMSIEPTNAPQKFPSAFIHVHYARGCSLAESFYQSVQGPYQLLIVGDALCRPWATIPEITVDGLAAGDDVKGTLEISPTATTTGPAVDRFELYLDGARVDTCLPGESLTLDTARYSDGSHELRVIGIEASPIETQGRLILPVRFDNHGRKITLEAKSTRVRANQSIELAADSPGSQSILIYSNGRRLGTINAARGAVSVKTTDLGTGPVSIRAVGMGARGAASHVLAVPVEITIDPVR
jgi:hypothetical protein